MEAFLINSAMLFSTVWFQVFGAVKSRLWVEVDDSGKGLTPRGNTETCNKYNSCHRICLPGKTVLDQFGHTLCSSYHYLSSRTAISKSSTEMMTSNITIWVWQQWEKLIQ